MQSSFSLAKSLESASGTVTKPKQRLKGSRSALTLKLIFGACLITSSMGGCATHSSAYGPVLLTDQDRSCLSRPAKEAIEANNETWLRDNQ